MKFFKFLISRTFFINVVVAITLTVAIIWGTFGYLKTFTRFNQTVTVPDLKGFTVEELSSFLKDKKLQYVQVEPVYDSKLPKGTVVSQNPKPNSLAKEDRKIYVRINSLPRPQSTVPKLVDLNFRGAKGKLLQAKLKVGIVITEPSAAKNFVLRMEKNGRIIHPGDKLPEWSTIDLVVGAGTSGEKIDLPNFMGLNLDDAKLKLGGRLLSIVPALYKECANIEDSSRATVFQQNPEYLEGATVYEGQIVSLWMTCGSDTLTNSNQTPKNNDE